MNIGAPISRVFQRQYGEAPNVRGLSTRDNRLTSKQWLNGQSDQRQTFGNARALAKIQQDLYRLKHRVITPPATFQPFPFQIYQEPNVTATKDQIALFTAQNANIDDYTIQIRSGMVSGRPYMSEYSTQNNSFTTGLSGNYESQMFFQGTDFPPQLEGNFENPFPPILDYFCYPQSPNYGQENTGITTVLDSVNSTLITGMTPGSPTYGGAVFSDQIALNPIIDGYDQFQSCAAAFWIELIDDPIIGPNGNGFYPNLMGRMFSLDPPSLIGRTDTPFPTGANIIPIGYYVVYANTEVSGYLPLIPTYLLQFQFGHAVNRFTPGANNYRGNWSEIFAALPSGATYLWFYPGDIVVDDLHADDNGYYIAKIWPATSAPVYLQVGTGPPSGFDNCYIAP